jgi:coenzyme F420-reducing hydrogenase gamma subunit
MKPKIGIFGLSGCWGEQIVILNCEDDLLDIVGAVDIVDFLGGSSANDHDAPLAVAFVEGSVGSAREEAAVKRIRERAALLVACGSCACFGGVSAVTSEVPRDQLARSVYGAGHPAYDLTPHRPVSDVVKVDVAIPGCPMEKDEFLRAVANLLNGDLPQPAAYPVCTECKMQEQDCLLVSRHIPCAGPVTAAGCGARCPGYNVPCIGCRGPVDEANFVSMREVLEKAGFSERDIWQKLQTFAAPAIQKDSIGTC